MKKIIRAIVIAFAAAITITACSTGGEKPVKESESKTAETSKAKAPETSSEEAEKAPDEKFFPGEIKDGVYISRMFKIRFDAVENDMTLADEKMLSKTNEGIADRKDVEAIKKKIKKDGVFLDMFAYKPDYKETIGVSILDASGLKDEEEYFNMAISKYEKDGKVKVEKAVGNFLGKEMPCLIYEEEVDGVKQYQKHAIIKKGDYIVNIIAKGGDEQTVQAELDMFTSLEDIDKKVDNNEESSADETTEANKKEDEENTDNAAAKTPNEKNESQSALQSEFTPGEVKDGIYTNKMFGVRLDGDANDMQFTARKELNPEFYTDGNLDVEAVKRGLEAGNKFIDMSANGPKNSCYVTVEKTAGVKDIDSYIEKAIPGLKASFEEEGFNVSAQKSSGKFLGEDIDYISVEASLEGSTIYQKIVFLKNGDYIYSVASFGDDEASAQKGLDMFTKSGK